MAEIKSLQDKLVDIQQRLKVPKTNQNDFGGFVYRNLEDIEDKIKPFLREHNLSMWFNDEPVEVGGRVYIKATVHLSDGKDEIVTYAYAREAATPKAKTDDAQLTGATSSYARKYAASGLFLIDNTKDADSQDNSVAYMTDAQHDEIAELLIATGTRSHEIPSVLDKRFGIPLGSDITFDKAESVLKDLRKK